MNKQTPYSKPQLWALVILRMAIGWHFLYEGISKLMNPNWTALPYLNDSQGLFSSFFHEMAANSTTLSVVNCLNTYGLILVGLGLICGFLTRYASVGAIIMLALYYLSHPPYMGAEYMLPTEGAYLWIDKSIIEICALVIIILFPTSQEIGLDRYVCQLFKKNKN